MVEIDEDEFIKTVNESLTMVEAARKLDIHFNTFKRLAKLYNCYTPNQGGKGTHKSARIKYDTNDILVGKYPEYQAYKLKRRLISEGFKENKCEICGISNWNGLPLNMELHHKDGNRFNNCLDNLQILCPNCHAQTDNFRAKNIKKKK